MSCDTRAAASESENDLSLSDWNGRVETASPPPKQPGALQRSMARLSSSRTNSWLGLVSDISVALYLLMAGFALAGSASAGTLAAVLVGAFAFSFVEYCFHRWLFHGSAALFEEGHDRHHEVPLGHDSLPFFFAPLGILGLSALIGLVAPQAIALLFTGGFAAGYAAYGLGHTLIHHVRFENLVLRRWAAAHHIHHHHPDRNFGVTSPLWDILLGTRYARSAPKAPR